MPFDTTTLEVDALEQLGIIPVPQTLVDQYKQTILENYCRNRPRHEPVLAGTVRWRSHQVGADGLRFTLLYPRQTYIQYGGMTLDRSRPPTELIRLAEYVERKIERAQFYIEYFYTDPILEVRYPNVTVVGGRSCAVNKTACLGIWDKGRIIHIAQHPLGRPPGWYRFVEPYIPSRWR